MKRWVSPTLRVLKVRRDLIGPEPEKPRSSYLEWNYDAEMYAFGKRLGEEFDKELLKQALIQREYVNMQEFAAKDKGTLLSLCRDFILVWGLHSKVVQKPFIF